MRNTKTGLRLPVKILIAFLALVLAFALFLLINGTCFRRASAAGEYLSSWMAAVPDGTLLKELAIPGSHDAGTDGMLWPFSTQYCSVGTQLSYGIRYMDIRVDKTDDGYRIYHSFSDGTYFSDVLSDIREFIVNHPSEVLLLDFQHFKGGSMPDVLEILSDSLVSEGLVLHNSTGKTDVDFISSLTLGEARGKCVVFFGETDTDPGDWVFLRNNDDCSKNGMTMDSCYLEHCHKGGYDALVSEGHPVYFDLLCSRQQSGEDCIFVLQCQLTDGNLIFGPWSVERNQEKKMDMYVRELAHSPYLTGINVIMRDFVTPEKCRDIIDLNVAKGVISHKWNKENGGNG